MERIYKLSDVYSESFPAFESVLAEVKNNPNQNKPKHTISDLKCSTHDVNYRVYSGIRKNGNAYKVHQCPICNSERERLRWLKKIKPDSLA